MRCHGAKFPLLTALVSLLSSFNPVTFLPEGVIVGFQNFAWGFILKKNKILGEIKFGGPHLPPGGSIFFFFFENTKSA